MWRLPLMHTEWWYFSPQLCFMHELETFGSNQALENCKMSVQRDQSIEFILKLSTWNLVFLSHCLTLMGWWTETPMWLMCQLCCSLCDAGLCLCNFQNCASKQAAVCRQAARQRCILGRREWSADVRDKGGWIGALQCLFWEYLRRQVRSWQEKEQSMCLCWQQRGFNKQRTFFCTGKNQYFISFAWQQRKRFLCSNNIWVSRWHIFIYTFSKVCSVSFLSRHAVSHCPKQTVHICRCQWAPVWYAVDTWKKLRVAMNIYLLPNTCIIADASSQTVMTLHFPVWLWF